MDVVVICSSFLLFRFLSCGYMTFPSSGAENLRAVSNFQLFLNSVLSWMYFVRVHMHVYWKVKLLMCSKLHSDASHLIIETHPRKSIASWKYHKKKLPLTHLTNHSLAASTPVVLRILCWTGTADGILYNKVHTKLKVVSEWWWVCFYTLVSWTTIWWDDLCIFNS